MARLFDDASSEYLGVASAPLSGYPLTMACWFYTDTAAISEAMMWLGDKDASDNYFSLWCRGASTGDPISFTARNTAETNCNSTSGFSVNTWHHACGVGTSATSRACYLNGGSKGTSVVSQTPNNADSATIGCNGDDTPALYFSGCIAEAAIWNVALTDAEVAELALGVCPLFIRPASLVAYWPLLTTEDNDPVGGYTLTPYNTPSTAAHPRMYYPAAQMIIPILAVALSTQPPRSMHQFRQRRV